MLETNSSITHPAVPTLDKLIQFFLFMFAASSMFSISITQISFALGALSWALKVHLTQTWKELWGTRVGIAIFCFCLACFLATATAVDLESSFKHLQKLLQFIIFFWVINTVHNEKQRDLLIRTIIIAGVLSALYGFYVHFQVSFFSASKLFGTRSTSATFAGVLMLASIVTLSWYLFDKPKKNWLLGGLGVLTFCLLITLTRQAWLGFFISSIFLLFFWNKKYLLIVPLLLAGLLFFAPDNVKDRIHTIGNIEESSFQSRVSLWRGGWAIFKDYPITGCGFKCVDAIHSQYPDPSGWIKFYRGMHNNIIQLLVDTGIIGLGLWVLIWVAFFIEIFKRLRGLTEETSHGNTKGILMGSSAAVIAFLVGGLFETSFYDSEMMMLLYFIMGLSLVKVQEAPRVAVTTFNMDRVLSVNHILWLDKAIQFSLYTFVIFCTLSISITQISFAIGVLAWLIKVHLTKTWDKIYRTPVGLPILCFCLASILAVITSVDYTASLPHLKKIIQFAILFWVANTVTNEKQKDLLIKLLIISGVIASIVGFSQAWSTAVTLQTRVSGTMSVYMTFAGLLMLVGLIASGRFLFNDTKEKWVMAAIGLIIFCLLLTLTRQAWLGFSVGLLVLIIFWNKKYLLALPVAMVGLLLFAPESVKDRIFSIINLSDWTFQARIFLWQGGLEIFKDYPITGCGFKCVDVLHTQYPDPSGYIAKYRGMHNNIIQLLVDTGILGLGTWLSIWVAYFLNTYKQWNKTTINGISKGLVIGSLAAVLGFLAGGMFETNFYDSEIAMLLYFIMGLSLAKTSKKVAP